MRLEPPIDLPLIQPVQQFLGLDIHQLDLIGVIKHLVRDPFPHNHAGNGRHHVVEALDMLDVYRGVNIDARSQQLLHILVSLFMPAALRVGVGQLVHQDQPGISLQRRLQIEFPQSNMVVGIFPYRQPLQPLQQLCGLRPHMRLHISRHHIDPLPFGRVGRRQHGIGFPNPGRISKKDV